MNRLTENKYPFLKIAESCAEICEIETKSVSSDTDPCLDCLISKAFQKLTAYEDTGLEPEEIKQSYNMYLEVYSKISEYADLMRQGLLIKLPCKEKDTIYILDEKGNIHECEVYNITTNIYANTDKKSVYWKGFEIKDNLFGKTVFLTKEEAEKVLEEMK